MSKPLVIDLCCGLGGWTKGFLAEGYEAVGFDTERHQYGDKRYPAQLVLQDITTLHGSQFRNAAVIVASPPCQRYWYMAQPWDRSKREMRWQNWERTSPFGDFQLNRLFDACFRIAAEAGVPIVVENVCGAQKWVGRAAWHYGSYYLWGDVPALMPITRSSVKASGQDWNNYAKTGEVSPHWRLEGAKTLGHVNQGDGFSHTRHLTNQRESDAVKGGGDWFSDPANPFRYFKQSGTSGDAWFDKGIAAHGSQSSARKAASALIAEIPFDLAQHIARVFKPESAFSMPMHQAGRSPAIQGVA